MKRKTLNIYQYFVEHQTGFYRQDESKEEKIYLKLDNHARNTV